MLLKQYASNELNRLKSIKLLRKLNSTQKLGNAVVYHNSQLYISFSCNDPFCLSTNPIVKQSAIAAIQKYGLGASSSRLITGNHDLYKMLEEKLAEESGHEASTVFPSGYDANIGVISSLLNRYDLIIADKLIHASLIDGAQLAKAKIIRFKHNNLQHCEDILKQHRRLYRHCLIVAEHVYSMNGNVAPIADLGTLSNQYNCWLLVDDAHGFGIVKMQYKPDIYIGTLSKALGSLGGYVCSSRDVIEYLHNKARSLIYTTALPTSVIAGAIVALDITKQHFAKPVEAAKIFCNELGLPEPQTNIIGLPLEDKNETQVQNKLLQNGFLVKIIRPPTVMKSQLRFIFSIAHTENNIKKLCSVLKSVGY